MGTLYLIKPSAELTEGERRRHPNYIDNMEVYGSSIGYERGDRSTFPIINMKGYNWSPTWLIPLKRRGGE